MMKTVIHSVFEEIVAQRPGRPAIRAEDGVITYGALNAAADRLARHLHDHQGVGRGTVVGLHLPMGIGYVTAMLGVAKAGGVFLPLDPAHPPRRQRACLAKAEPALILGDADAAGVLPALETAVPLLRLDAVPLGPADPLPLSVDGEDASYIVFTSGSTGEPKAILGSQKGLGHFVDWEVREFGLDETVRVAQLAPPTFDVSLRDIFVPLLAGGTLCIPPAEARTDGRRLIDWLDAECITLVHCVPSLFRALMHELAQRPRPGALLTRLRHLLLAGEPLYGADVWRWRDLMGEGTELVNLYGPSETTLAKAFHRIRGLPPEPGRMIPVGRPLPNTALLILKDGELCDPGEIGEIFIRTPFMSKGYCRDPEATARAFVQNPLTPGRPDLIYRTGDLGRYLPDRSVELLGRQDGQVKVNGVRIELAEIEQALLGHPLIEQAVVAAHASANQEVHLTAYFVAGRPLADADLRRHLRDWLPPAMNPAFFVQMESFPLNLHGKVNRRALPRPADLLYRDRPCVAPADATEQELAVLWDEVLDLRKVGVTHGFAELGGDSLKAIRVLGRICRHFGVDIKLQELFPDATIRGLAALIDERRQDAAGAELAIAPPSEEELRWLAE
jgi:amino acid adenylation domain-containing protein